MAESQPPQRISLADAIAELRGELSKAQQEGEGKDIRFAAKSIEVELSLDFGWAAEGTAGVAKWIPFVDLEASGSGSQQSRHRVKLLLEIDTDGNPSRRLINDVTGPAPVKSTS